MAGVYGTIVSRADVEQAIIDTLALWTEAQLEDFERQRDLSFETVPRLDSVGIYGGLDPETFRQEDLPALIVNCEPVGVPELDSDANYLQWYTATITALVESTDEQDARWLADAYGTAVMGAIGQHGSLGKFALDTRLTLAPDAKFIDPDKRRFGVSDTVFQTLVPVMNRRAGPAVPPPVRQQPPGPVSVTSVKTPLTTLP